MKKPSFLNQAHPLICSMVLEDTPDKIIPQILNSRYEGATAIGIQLDCLKKEYRTREHLSRIFSAAGELPIYITSYRGRESSDLTDDELAELLILGIESGATLADIMADMFSPAKYEFTYDEEAIEKQKALAKKIHDLGGEVLFSSHVHAFLPEEKIVEIAKGQEERGADVVKIVTFATTEEELIEDIGICSRLKNHISKDYLFLANGAYCRLLRQITGRLGSCMYLCTRDYALVGSNEQPILRAQKAIVDGMGY
ncbi:MAG: type I 3-dehydroquinate dehydratase [Clostridia bacterium]|nr:type I 3-dehydroquinate dehydratase [Clostridia bacterium]